MLTPLLEQGQKPLDSILDVELILSDRELRNEQKVELKQIADGCRNVLVQLEHTLDEYDELKSGHGSVSQRVKRTWKETQMGAGRH